MKKSNPTTTKSRVAAAHLNLKQKIAAAMQQLARTFIGYQELHFTAAIVHQLAGGQMLLIGQHGRGKSSFARTIAALGDQKFVSYDSSKADSNMIAGFLDPRQATEGGGVPFIRHTMTIWDKEVVFFDEINRAPYQNQNALLEVMEERTLWGWKLDHLSLVIAAANSGAGYQATLELDAALFDRFMGVLFIREENLDENAITDLLNKPIETSRSFMRFDENDRATFMASVQQLTDRYLRPLAAFSGSLLINLQKMLAHSFSDRTMLQFRSSFFSFLALAELTQDTFEDRKRIAFYNAVEYTLLNKARAARPSNQLFNDLVNPKPNQDPAVTHFLEQQATELCQLLQSASLDLPDPQRLANLMFVGTPLAKLKVYETHRELIQKDDVAQHNATLALEQIISDADIKTLNQIANSSYLSQDLILKAEFARLRTIFDRDLYQAFLEDSTIQPERFRDAVGASKLVDFQNRNSILRALAPNPTLVTDDELESFLITSRELEYHCTKELLQDGLLLLRYHGDIDFNDIPCLPMATPKILNHLLPFLYVVDAGVNTQIAAVARYKNGFRAADDSKSFLRTSSSFPGSDRIKPGPTIYLLPSFTAPHYFVRCREISIANKLRHFSHSSIAALVAKLTERPDMQEAT